ncbi:sensor histidine kinase [Pseudomonas duriflava]|nr:histidine kinase dimerization/phosphoacceptor domain -containing protein [Pseudomonas duriflava]
MFRNRPWLAHVTGLLAFGLALFIRLGLSDVLSGGFPYLTFFPAVILTTFFCGTRPGVVCAMLSGVASWYFFITPAYSLHLDGQGILAMVFYAFIVSVDIALIHFMHVASDRLREQQAVTEGLYQQQRTMFQELQHRVANNMQFVAALLKMQRRKVSEDPIATAALDEARERLEMLAQIHRHLYAPERANLPVSQHLQELCTGLLEATGAKNIVCKVSAPPITLDLTRLTTLSLLVVEVMTNAVKHAFTTDAHGTITVQLEMTTPDTYSLIITDDGKGVPASFAKVSSKSLGLTIIQSLSSQLGGRVEYHSGQGTTVRVQFPVTA